MGEAGREREGMDAAQFIRPDSKMYSKVAEMMRLFRVQPSVESPYSRIFERAHSHKSFLLIATSDRTSDTFPRRSVLC